MANKIYAVKDGRTKGIFNTWEDCEAQVKGFKGAKYKSFTSIDEAFAYLNGDDETFAAQVTAYVDGSFEAETGVYSFGCVILIFKDGKIEEILESGCDNKPEYAVHRNVAGEVFGAMYAAKWCREHGYKSLEIKYDYTGIENWGMGNWKTNTELTSRYAEYMKDMRKSLEISFTKVAAHTGVKYNEMADKLAKGALENPDAKTISDIF